MNMLHKITFCCALLSLAFLPWNATAQLNPYAPTEAMDTLNQGSVGGGLNPATYTGRAQGVAGGGGLPGAGSPFGAPAAGGSPFGGQAGGGASPFGGPAGGGSPFGGPAGGATPFGAAAQPAGTPGFGGGPSPDVYGGVDPYAIGGAGPGVAAFDNPQFGGQQQQQIQLPPLPQTARVLGGERIYCAVSGRILSDAEWRYVWTTEAQQNYYDDGTHGDPRPNDEYYSNIVIRNDVIAPEVWRVFRRTKQMIRTAGEKTPIEFFGITAVTTDPASRIPQYTQKEEERDSRLIEWNNKFLREYRVNPDDVQSEFYKPFIPKPPSAPDIPVPAGFEPPNRQGFEPGEQAPASFDQFLGTGGGLQPGAPGAFGADPFGTGVTGVPANPAASSNYFSTTAVGGSQK